MAVHFHFIKSCRLPDRRRLKAFIPGIFPAYGYSLCDLQVVFCDDKYLLKMNKQFLQHDYYTDIITFDLSNDPAIKTGELYISVDRVKENAASQNVDFITELHRVIFHGILHLCDLKDKSKKEAREIRAKEDKLLGQYLDVPRGT